MRKEESQSQSISSNVAEMTSVFIPHKYILFLELRACTSVVDNEDLVEFGNARTPRGT